MVRVTLELHLILNFVCLCALVMMILRVCALWEHRKLIARVLIASFVTYTAGVFGMHIFGIVASGCE